MSGALHVYSWLSNIATSKLNSQRIRREYKGITSQTLNSRLFDSVSVSEKQKKYPKNTIGQLRLREKIFNLAFC